MKNIHDLTVDELITSVNKDFKIKINGKNFVGKSLSILVGYEGLKDVLDDDSLTERICRDALCCPDDVFSRKLRRGLIIRFYSK